MKRYYLTDIERKVYQIALNDFKFKRIQSDSAEGYLNKLCSRTGRDQEDIKGILDSLHKKKAITVQDGKIVIVK